MALSLELSSTAAERVAVDLLAVPVFSDRKLGPGGAAVNDAIGGGLDEFMAETGFEGKRGETLAVPTRGQLRGRGGARRHGRRQETRRRRPSPGGRLAGQAVGQGESVATTVLDAAPDGLDRADAAQALAEGVRLGAYQFLKYKGDGKPSQLKKVVVLGRSSAKVRAALERGVRIAEAVRVARDLVNEPAGAKSPEDIAKLARTLGHANGLTVKVLAGEQLAASGWVACSASARVRNGRRGSCGSRTNRVARGRRSGSSARASCSTPAACPSRPRPAWRR